MLLLYYDGCYQEQDRVEKKQAVSHIGLECEILSFC